MNGVSHERHYSSQERADWNVKMIGSSCVLLVCYSAVGNGYFDLLPLLPVPVSTFLAGVMALMAYAIHTLRNVWMSLDHRI